VRNAINGAIGGWASILRDLDIGLLRRIAALSFAFFMVACASQDTGPQAGYDQSSAKRVFSVGYQDISNIYIDQVSVANLAIAGMEGLASIDPAISVERDAGLISVSVNGSWAGNIAMPSQMDPQGWARVTATAISMSRDYSADLNAADPEQLYEVVFEGILGELDGFSRYSSREAARESRASREGFGGIGVRIRLVEEGVLILSVMEETPAELAGFHKDDVITHIDGDSVEGLSQREAVSRLRGKVRTRVRLTVDRPAIGESLEISVVRAHIIPQTVKYHREDNIGYLQISGFNQNTTRSLQEKIELAREEIGDELIGFVVDLRDNPGGLLDQAVSVSDLFISNGRIVSTQGRHPDSHQYFEADSQDLTNGVPIALLVNGNSASASEIVAAALQDAHRAVVIGSVSYGKGTVQTLLRLPNQGELTLTWARFMAPSGYALNRRGILPDICTSGGGEDAASVLEAMSPGADGFDWSLRTRSFAPNDEEGVEAFRNNCPARNNGSDVDLLVAKRLLRDPTLYARIVNGPPNTADLGASLTTQ
jgi:carboxyl-terminal processing protease